MCKFVMCEWDAEAGAPERTYISRSTVHLCSFAVTNLNLNLKDLNLGVEWSAALRCGCNQQRHLSKWHILLWCSQLVTHALQTE